MSKVQAKRRSANRTHGYISIRLISRTDKSMVRIFAAPPPVTPIEPSALDLTPKVGRATSWAVGDSHHSKPLKKSAHVAVPEHRAQLYAFADAGELTAVLFKVMVSFVMFRVAPDVFEYWIAENTTLSPAR